MKLEVVDDTVKKDDKPVWEQTQEKDPGYTGADRRAAQRRIHSDRREMLRFDPDKEDRRQTNDRRAPKSVWDDRML